MKLRTLLCFCLVSVLLTGCLDKWYPSNLSGSVRQGIYHFQTRNAHLTNLDKYEILVPQAYNIYQTPMMYSHEFMGDAYTAVSFGPTTTDSTVYSLMLVDKRDRSLAEIQAQYFPIFLRRLAASDASQMRTIFQTETTMNGRDALYTVFDVVEPDVYNYISERQPGHIVKTHALHVVDYGRYAALFWIQFSSNSSLNRIDKHAKELILQQRYLPQTRFIHSLRIHEFLVEKCVKCK